MNKFWIVVGAQRGAASSPYRHPSKDKAVEEAERLCRAYKDTFFVMEAVSQSVIRDVITEDLHEAMPF